MENYFSFYWFLVKWHALELFLGKVLLTWVLNDALYCTLDGENKWMYRSGFGVLFTMLHILGTMQATGMARAVFIKNPKSTGLFGGFEEEPAKEAKKQA